MATLLAASVLIGTLALACDFVSDDDDGDEPAAGSPVATTTTPTATTATSPADHTSAEEALRLFVERRLSQGFVSDCEEIRRPGDVGKQCATLRGERNGLLAYELGPTFSEYTRLLILEPVDGTWTIVHSETRDLSLPAPEGIPWPLTVGANVIVSGTGDCLRIREQPGTNQPELACVEDGTAVTITDAAADEVDGIEWWFLEGYGWAAGDYLRYADD